MSILVALKVSLASATVRAIVSKTDGSPSSGGDSGPTLVTSPTFTFNGTVTNLGTPLSYDNYLLWRLPNVPSTLTATAPLGWLTTTDGSAPALTGASATFDEAVLPTITDRSGVAIGTNLPDTGTNRYLTIYGDRFRWSGGWVSWGGSFTTDSSDNLTTLTGSTIVQVSGTGLNNGVDNSGYPSTPAGNWTLFFRGTTQDSVILTDLNLVLTDITHVGSDVVSNGITKRVYHLNPPSGKRDCTLWVQVTQSGGGACDFVPLGLFPPGESADGSQAYSQVLATQLNGFTKVRTMDLDAVNSSNVTLASQIPASTKLFPTKAPAPVTVNVTTVAPWAGGATEFPDTHSQLTFTTSSPHGFTDGAVIRLSGSGLVGLPFVDSNTYSLDGMVTTIRVLSSTTFGGFCGAPVQISGSHAVSGVTTTKSIVPPCPPEHEVAFAQLVGTVRTMHVCVPARMTMSEVRLLADRRFASLPTGWTLEVERSNETWNRTIGFLQSFDDEAAAIDAGLTAGAYHAAQSKLIHDQFNAARVAAGKPPSSLVRVICGFWGGQSRTYEIAGWCAANSYQFDLFLIAPYIDAGPPTGFDSWWAASTADQRFDALELWITHNPNYTTALAAHKAILVASNLTANVGVYECSMESLCPAGTGYGPKSLADSYHPRAAAIMDAALAQFKSQGCTSFYYYSACLPNGSDNSGVVAWNYALYYGPDTIDGLGSGSPATSPIAYTLKQWSRASSSLTPESTVPTLSTTQPLIRTRQHSLTGATLYAVIDDINSGQTWNGTAFDFGSGARSGYAVPLAEYDLGDFAAPVPAGINTPRLLGITIFRQAGNSPSAANDSEVATGSIDWTGAAILASQTPMNVNLAQPITDVKTATVGGAMNGAWAVGWGKILRNAQTRILSVWGAGNSTNTPSGTFQLDNASSPNSKTPQ